MYCNFGLKVADIEKQLSYKTQLHGFERNEMRLMFHQKPNFLIYL